MNDRLQTRLMIAHAVVIAVGAVVLLGMAVYAFMQVGS